jgi:hypothetical protein
MKYVVRTFIAMFLFAFCWVAVGYGIYQMLGIGTCASGGPYVVARECPDGTTAIFFALMGGIIGHFIAAGIYLTRGTPPGGRPPQNAGIILWFWTGIFWSLAIGCFLAVWGPDANPGPGAKEGGLIVGFMGLIFGIGGIWATSLGRKTARAFSLPGTGSPRALAKVDQGRINALARLRQDGSLTDDEFETLKNKIVRED